ncbi:unnamed protein product [Ceutorhynchus assimilis]|uniref:Gem-associated protein 5 n=1 Tax=Ceutorhynchus assimilis TaxID=467358 RepID=A0A9N9MUX7_9CUCU|nr:unnamed protein product [Ceutorhynchus assimilis]
MNKLTIPSSPNWYESDIMACAPDNTLLYGSRQDLVVIKPTDAEEPDDIRVLAKAHSMKIVSVNLNRNWGDPHKYAVTVSEDKIVKAWDVEKLEKISSHDKHLADQSKIVGASFAGDVRIVSVSETGSVILWYLSTDETNSINSLFGNKVTVTCMSICPHANWLAVFGLKSGLIVVTDLRRTGKVLYSLRGHSKSVVSLAWCPAPVNIFPATPLNKVVEKFDESSQENQSLVELGAKSSEEASAVKSYEETSAVKSSEEASVDKLSEIKELLTSADKMSEDNQSLSSAAKSPETNELKESSEEKELLTSTSEENQSVKSPAEELSTSTDKEVSSTDKEVLSTDKEVSSTDKEVSSTDKEVSSTDKEVSSTNKEVSSTDKEVPSTDKEVISTDKEVSSADKELASTDTQVSPTDTQPEIVEQQKSPDQSESRRKQKNPKKDPNSGTQFTHCCNTDSEKKPKIVSKISDFLAKTQKQDSDGSCSSEENRQFCSASSCDNDLNCSKRIKEPSPKKLENEVFYDAQEEEKPINTELIRKNEQPRKEFLLASSARETNIYIWRAGTDGRMQTFLKVPAPKKPSNRKKAKETLPWISLCWPTPTTLLSSSHTAELIAWTLPKPGQSGKFFRTVHREHWSVLFSIKAPLLYLNEYNFLQKKPMNVWTTGMERNVVSTDLDTGDGLCFYPAFGGSVNCLDGSPLDPNRLAIGTGEGLINTWDLSRPHIKSINFSVFYNQILSSVTALAWHPINENLLAWGTSEGRIGVLDVAHKSKAPKILKHYFKSQIFKLEWGPADSETGKNQLFVVGESKVAIFCTESREKDPEMLPLPDNTSVFTMAWKPDYSMLLVSAKSGTIITYNPKLEIQSISYLSNKLLSIKWHPDAVSNDTNDSKYSNTFASLIKHSEIIVMDLNAEEDCKITAKFENRGVKIGDFAWSPHSGNLLVLVDDCGAAQVFDVEAQNIVSTYISPALDQLLSVYWSPLDPDFIITGTISHKIIIWKISENPAMTEKDINSRKNKITKTLQKEVGDLLNKQVKAKEEPVKPKPASKSEIVPLFYSPKDWIQNLEILLQNKLENTSDSNENLVSILDILGDSGNMEKLFSLNLKNFKKQGQFKRANLLALFQGDLKEAIKEAIEHRRVDAWIISVCPMVSPKLWQTACDTYVEQLIEEPEADPMEIVTYMLVCHRVEEAVNFLRERELYREAFTLAKGRFGAGAALTAQVAEEWAKKATYQGNFEWAAGCYISLEKYNEAAAVLFRRSDIDTLKFSAHLAQLADNEDLHKAILSRLNAFKPAEEPKIDEKLTKDDLLLEELSQLDKDIVEVQNNLEKVVNEEKELVNNGPSVTDKEQVSKNLESNDSEGDSNIVKNEEVTEKLQTEIPKIVLTETEELSLEEKE